MCSLVYIVVMVCLYYTKHNHLALPILTSTDNMMDRVLVSVLVLVVVVVYNSLKMALVGNGCRKNLLLFLRSCCSYRMLIFQDFQMPKT